MSGFSPKYGTTIDLNKKKDKDFMGSNTNKIKIDKKSGS